MIKVSFKNSNNKIYEVEIKGHANYADYGKDIVCSAVSTMAITTVNAILSLEETIDASEKSGLLVIRTLKDTEVNQKLLSNMKRMLEELKSQYPENIEIRNED
jgi:uncharacterized protein YsxB (DUF464 family)